MSIREALNKKRRFGVSMNHCKGRLLLLPSTRLLVVGIAPHGTRGPSPSLTKSSYPTYPGRPNPHTPATPTRLAGTPLVSSPSSRAPETWLSPRRSARGRTAAAWRGLTGSSGQWHRSRTQGGAGGGWGGGEKACSGVVMVVQRVVFGLGEGILGILWMKYDEIIQLLVQMCLRRRSR